MYKVSVVTPFHNVDMGMFSKCASSMRSQTIGFENVEWIIVVHNSEPHYMPLLTQMFKDDKNVTVKELHDRFHSPATPRNCGVKLVTAPCVGFLDADDSYTPECIEVARREMMETGAQIVTFRREYELETESLHPHTEVVAWNLTQWRIVMDRKDERIPCTEKHMKPYAESFATTLKGHHNLLVAMVGPRSKQTNDGCTIETLESMMVKLYMWRFHYARGKRRADFSMPDRLFFKTEPHDEQHAICYYALLDRDIDQIVALNTRRVSDMFQYMKEHQDQLVAEIRETDKDRATEVEHALQSAEPLACALWPKLERIVAFGAGEYAEATALMKEFTGNMPHNHGYCYTEETICGRAVEDNSDLFETVQSGSFHEYMPAGGDNETTLLSTDVKQGEEYQLVVTNSAGLYRFVTSHRVCIEDVQLDRTLFKLVRG